MQIESIDFFVWSTFHGGDSLIDSESRSFSCQFDSARYKVNKT